MPEPTPLFYICPHCGPMIETVEIAVWQPECAHEPSTEEAMLAVAGIFRERHLREVHAQDSS